MLPHNGPRSISMQLATSLPFALGGWQCPLRKSVSDVQPEILKRYPSCGPGVLLHNPLTTLKHFFTSSPSQGPASNHFPVILQRHTKSTVHDMHPKTNRSSVSGGLVACSLRKRLFRYVHCSGQHEKGSITPPNESLRSSLPLLTG
jgi:hypothetical protein